MLLLVFVTSGCYNTLATILSIVNEDNKVYLIAFHFCTFTVAKLNYDTYNCYGTLNTNNFLFYFLLFFLILLFFFFFFILFSWRDDEEGT